MPSPPGHPLGPHAEVGWRLARSAWGHGYATEAAQASLDDVFTRCGLTEVLAYTAPDNLRSQAVMSRLELRRDPARDFSIPDGPRIWHGLTWVATGAATKTPQTAENGPSRIIGVSASGARPETPPVPPDEPPVGGGRFGRRRRVWLTGLIVARRARRRRDLCRHSRLVAAAARPGAGQQDRVRRRQEGDREPPVGARTVGRRLPADPALARRDRDRALLRRRAMRPASAPA